MSYISIISNDNVALTGKLKVIPPKDVACFDHLADVSEQLSTALANYSAVLEEDRDKAIASGREEGLEQARKYMHSKLAKKYTELALAHALEQQRMAENAVDLAMQIIQNIAGHLGSNKTVLAMAASACESFQYENEMTLYVSEDNYEYVSTVISEHNQQTNTPYRGIIDVKLDNQLSLYECMLETRYGSTIANLDHQLQAIKSSLLTELENSKYFSDLKGEL